MFPPPPQLDSIITIPQTTSKFLFLREPFMENSSIIITKSHYLNSHSIDTFGF